jgi:hypothetical protein
MQQKNYRTNFRLGLRKEESSKASLSQDSHREFERESITRQEKGRTSSIGKLFNMETAEPALAVETASPGPVLKYNPAQVTQVSWNFGRTKPQTA